MRLPGIVRSMPFTIVMLVLIAAVGLTTATHLDRLAPSLLRRFGFVPFHLHVSSCSGGMQLSFPIPARYTAISGLCRRSLPVTNTSTMQIRSALR